MKNKNKNTKTTTHTFLPHFPSPTLILSARFAITDFTSISSLFVISELLILFVSAPASGCCQVFTRKLEEVGRVLFLISLTQKIPTAHKQSHVSMLQEDLLRLPSFPRSAIDAEFSLFSDPQGTQTKASLLSGISCPCLARGWRASPSADSSVSQGFSALTASESLQTQVAGPHPPPSSFWLSGSKMGPGNLHF